MPKSKDLNDNEMIQLIQKMVRAQIYSLVITGGEPFARPIITLKTAEIAKKAGMFVSINTNLLLLTPEAIIELKKIKIDSLLVSCPASDPTIYKQITRLGNYDQLHTKLELLLSADVSCLINMVVTPINNRFIRSTATDMSKLGIKRFAATPASLNVEHPNNQELLNRQQTITLLEDLRWCSDYLGLKVDILEPLPKCFLPDWCWEKNYTFTKRTCQAGRMSVSVSNTGDVRPCSHNPIAYGNLLQESLKHIWSKMNIYRNDITPVICKSCSTVSICNGACRTNSLATTGLLNETDRLTVGPTILPAIKRPEIKIEDDSVVHFKGKLRFRPEAKNYSISSKNSGDNLIIVNKEMFRFIRWLEKSLPLSVKELIENGATNSKKTDFTKILELLIKKEFVYLT